jgi:hypothetical protein
LVIPDAHAHPDFNNRRFKWLGELVADLKPDKVICLGDWADLPSLCTYDKGTKGFEGRRYKDDIASAIQAQEFFFAPIKARKKKQPKFIMLEGNHEYRIKRAINSDAAQLDGIISPDDLLYRKFGWDYVEYEGATPGVVEEDGIAYAHYFTSGVMGRPIGGIHPAYQLIHKQYMSCTQGHVHTTDYCVRTSANGRNLHGLVAGCYQDYYADWAGEANNLWWKGVVFKENVENGQYDPRWISLATIKKEYA